MKKFRHTFDDGLVINLVVPSCLRDCPYCHQTVCMQDKSRPRQMSPQDKDTAERDGFPVWCPLETESFMEKLGRRLGEQEMEIKT